jgi:HEAT repeat protein
MRRCRVRSRVRSHGPYSIADMAATLALMLPLLIACGDTPAQARPDARQLMAQLSSADPQSRAKAACALREMGDEAAVAIDPLVALLPDGAPIPQTVCERNWGRWNREQTTTPGEQAASALVAIGSRTVKPLLAAVTHSSWIARRNAAWALGALDDSTASPALMKALSDSEPPVREQAAWALGAIDEPSAVEALIRALKDSDKGVRQQAAWALGAIDDPRAVSALMQSLKDSEPEVREQAAWALGAIGDHRALDALLPALKDTEARVRRQAAWAIGVLSR